MRAALYLFFFLTPFLASAALPPQCKNILQRTLQKKVCPKSLPIQCKNIDKLIFWQCSQSPKNTISFEKLMQFMQKHPHLPRVNLIQQRAEEKLRFKTPPAHILKWFENTTPLTARGNFFLARAYLKKGQKSKAAQVIKQTWEEGYFTPKFQKEFYKHFRAHITYGDHLKRIESLAWKKQHRGLTQMKPYVDREVRLLIDALIALIRNQKGLDKKVRALPKKFHNHPVFLYHRIQWRLKHRKLKDVLQLFKQVQQAKADQRHPEAWYPLKHRLMRHYLDHEKFSIAYSLIANHHIKSGTNRIFAEWHAGWIALRKLGEAQKALSHLKKFHDAAKTPISKSKGAFYIAQAYDALDMQDNAKIWLEKSAQHPLTFYGQRALDALGRDLKHQIRPHNKNHIPKHPGLKDFEYIFPQLSQSGFKKLLKVFVIHGARYFIEEEDRAHFVYLVRKHAPQYAVLAAKIAGKNGSLALSEAYPVLEKHLLPKEYHESLPLPVIHAIIRQESGFNHHDISPAGAHGLMQLMPRTAKYIAKKSKISYRNPHDLLRHPHLNVSLGVNYLHGLLHRYEGNLVLSLAGYNAGETRVKRWMQRYGDPRQTNVNILDWIESIPFEETQSYIYRILESVPVYEFLHPDHPHALPLVMPALKVPSPSRKATQKIHKKSKTSRKSRPRKKIIKKQNRKQRGQKQRVIKKKTHSKKRAIKKEANKQ